LARCVPSRRDASKKLIPPGEKLFARSTALSERPEDAPNCGGAVKALCSRGTSWKLNWQGRKRSRQTGLLTRPVYPAFSMRRSESLAHGNRGGGGRETELYLPVGRSLLPA